MRNAVNALVALLCLAIALTAAAAANARRVALVIGNSAYEHTAPLANPANDAADVAASLERLGFDVTRGIDLTKTGMDDAFRRFARSLAGADAAMVYYAGHGMQLNGSNYLMPIDAKLEYEADVPYEMARLDDILAELSRVDGVRIVVLDSCRNNPLEQRLKSTLARTRGVELTRGLARIDRTQGLLVAFATQPGEVASDGDERNSPFTSALLSYIETPGLEVGPLFRRVASEVHERTDRQQLPELSVSLLGEFYFKPADAAADASSASPSDQGPDDRNATPSSHCAIAELHYREAVDIGTRGALEDHIRRFGDCDFAVLAEQRLDQLEEGAAETDVAVGVFPEPPRTEPEPRTPPPALTRSLDLKVQAFVPLNDPTIGPALSDFVEEVSSISGRKITVELLQPGAVVHAFQIYDAVSQGVLNAGLSSPVYAYGKNRTFQILSGSMPFGLSPERLLAWYEAEGQALADDVYAEHGLKMMPCAVTGSQGGGWHTRRLTDGSSYNGLRMRFTGLSADVAQAAGASVVQLPGGEIYPAMQRGVIDAFEFAWPLSDLAFGAQDVAKYYYFPSWHDPASIVDFVVSETFWNGLSAGERQVFDTACRNTIAKSLARIPVQEREGLDRIRAAGVEIGAFPPALLQRLRQASEQVLGQMSRDDPGFARVYGSYRNFR